MNSEAAHILRIEGLQLLYGCEALHLLDDAGQPQICSLLLFLAFSGKDEIVTDHAIRQPPAENKTTPLAPGVLNMLTWIVVQHESAFATGILFSWTNKSTFMTCLCFQVQPSKSCGALMRSLQVFFTALLWCGVLQVLRSLHLRCLLLFEDTFMRSDSRTLVWHLLCICFIGTFMCLYGSASSLQANLPLWYREAGGPGAWWIKAGGYATHELLAVYEQASSRTSWLKAFFVNLVNFVKLVFRTPPILLVHCQSKEAAVVFWTLSAGPALI